MNANMRRGHEQLVEHMMEEHLDEDSDWLCMGLSENDLLATSPTWLIWKHEGLHHDYDAEAKEQALSGCAGIFAGIIIIVVGLAFLLALTALLA